MDKLYCTCSASQVVYKDPVKGAGSLDKEIPQLQGFGLSLILDKHNN